MNAPTHIQRTPWSRSRSGRIFLVLLVSFAFMAGLMVVSARLASATTLTVTNANDSGEGSLRQAIIDANSGGTITFSPDLNGQTITLTSGELGIDKDLTIEGPGADKLAVSGNIASRVFYIGSYQSQAKVSISGLEIKDAHNEGWGGGIADDYGTLSLTDSTLRDNFTAYGAGGIHNNYGTVTLERVTVSGNISAFGAGGVENWGGAMTVRNSTVSDSNSHGIYTYYGTFNIINSTISGNKGGGIRADGPITLTNSTVSGNTATYPDQHGGIFNNGHTVTLTNSTIYNNSAPDSTNLYNNPGGRITLKDTIVGSPQGGGQNCVNDGTGIIASEGNNLEDGTSCGFTSTGDIQSQDPLLGPLANNGGPTQTHALLPGSPAIDKAATVEGITTDQRGVARPQGAAPDIGAFELDKSSPRITSVRPRNNATGVAPGVNVTATFSEQMQGDTVESAFKLYRKGSTTPVAAAVTYDDTAMKATLDPTNNLRRGVTYKAVLSTEARDLAGYQLDQNSDLSGLQLKKWFFTVRR